MLKLVGVDTCRDSLGLIECLGKVQLSVSDFCTVQLIPDIKVALDGTFCELSNGVQRGALVACRAQRARAAAAAACCLPARLVYDSTPCCIRRAGSVFGRLSLGQSHLDFEFKNAPQPGMVGMNVRGRVVPSEGGMEKQVDCNFLYNVSTGAAMSAAASSYVLVRNRDCTSHCCTRCR